MSLISRSQAQPPTTSSCSLDLVGRLRYLLQVSYPVFSYRATRRQNWACHFLHCVIALPLSWHSPRLVSDLSLREERTNKGKRCCLGLGQDCPKSPIFKTILPIEEACCARAWSPGVEGQGGAMVGRSSLQSQRHHPKGFPCWELFSPRLLFYR